MLLFTVINAPIQNLLENRKKKTRNKICKGPDPVNTLQQQHQRHYKQIIIMCYKLRVLTVAMPVRITKLHYVNRMKKQSMISATKMCKKIALVKTNTCNMCWNAVLVSDCCIDHNEQDGLSLTGE
jgi:hypothetical protein